MKKSQKIWLAISLSMFLIPELLWSPVLGLWSIDKRIFELANRNFLIFIIFIEIVGALATSLFIFKINKFKKIIHFLIAILLILFFVKAGYILYFLYATKNIQF